MFAVALATFIFVIHGYLELCVLVWVAWRFFTGRISLHDLLHAILFIGMGQALVAMLRQLMK